MTDQTKFEEWAIVDVMGHQRFVGLVSEQVIAGQGFIRVDIPNVVGVLAWTKLIGPSSIYAITPVTEDVARAMAEKQKSVPIQPFDFTRDMMTAGTKHLPFNHEDDTVRGRRLHMKVAKIAAAETLKWHNRKVMPGHFLKNTTKTTVEGIDGCNFGTQ